MTNTVFKEKIASKGIKQVWIADKLGVSKGLVSQWVNGSTAIPKKYLPQLKALLK